MSLISKLNRKLFYRETDREVKIRDAIINISAAIIHDIGLERLAEDWLKNNSHPFIKMSKESSNVVLLLNLDKYATIIKELVFNDSEYTNLDFMENIGSELKCLYIGQVQEMGLLPVTTWMYNSGVVVFDDFKNQPIAQHSPFIKINDQPSQSEIRFFADEELTIVNPSRVSIYVDYEFSYTYGLFSNEPSMPKSAPVINRVGTGSGMPLTSFAITANSVNRTISLPGFTVEVREKFANVHSAGITDFNNVVKPRYSPFFSSCGFMNMVVRSNEEMVIYSTPELPFINENKLSIESNIPDHFTSLSHLIENLDMDKLDRGLTTLTFDDGYTVSWFVYTYLEVEHKAIY